ncbi:MAG TPA: tetratricopeptide repeat protein [Steroidobacteraceae bacterium]|nr:tetratricopeptide repeat protein [Steroidobacteraceae bacterium]
MLLRGPTSRWSIIVIVALLATIAAGCGGAEARKARHLERGQSYLAAGNYEKARIEFRNALQIDPKDVQARYLSGQVAEKLGNLRDAVGLYQSVIDTDPQYAKAVASLGRLYVLGGVPDRALRLVEPALAKGEDANLLTVRGAARLQTGDAQGALADATRAVALEPANTNAVALLAGIYQRGGEGAKAVALLNEALKREPRSTDLHQVLGQLYVQLRDQEGAERELQELVKLDPQQLSYRYRLAAFYASIKEPAKAEATLREAVKAAPAASEPKIALAEFLVSRGDRKAAEEQLQKFIAADPDNADLSFGLARLYESGNQLDRAEAVYLDVSKRDAKGPQGLTALNRIAALKVQENKLDEASRLVGQVLEASPRDNDALILRGNIALARGQPAAAIADLRAVLRDQPNSSSILRTLARAHLQNNEPALAQENLKQAVESNPQDIEARVDLGRLMTRSSDPQEVRQALASLEQVVRDAPTNVGARDALFRAQVTLKDWTAAQRTAEDIKLLQPQQALGYYLAGLAAQAAGDTSAGRREFERALELQPDANEPLDALVRLDLMAKHPEVALARLQAVVERNPQNVIARNLLGEVRLTQKQPDAAVKEFEAASTQSPQWWLPYRNIALARLLQGNRAAAIDSYKRGIKATDGAETLSADLATLYERGGQYNEAIHVYEDLLAHNSASDFAANNLAMLLVTYRKDQASLDRARDLVNRFSQSANPSYLDTHGWVKYKRGEVTAALPVLEAVVTQEPESAVMRYHLAMAQYRSGQVEQARDNLERALASGNRFAGSDEAQSTLAQIKKNSG